MNIAGLGRWLSGSAPVLGIPPAPLQFFLYALPPRVGRNRDDINARIGRIKTAAVDADRKADALDAATDVAGADLAKRNLAGSRKTLCDELVALRATRFWARRRLIKADDNSVPTTGCGLLEVQTWIQQRDPSIFKILLELQARLADNERLPDLLWSLEARCFVFPDKGPLDALLESMRTAGIAWDEAWAVPLIEKLRADDFWTPDGTKSLDKLLEAVTVEAGAAGGAAAMPEGDVRTELANFNWEWAGLRDALKQTDDGQQRLRRILVFRKQLTDRLMAESVEEIARTERLRFRPYRSVRYSVPGSTRLTSDIDVNMRGSSTEHVAIEFNRRFREWTRSAGPMPVAELESGYVFDVNVYAQDYTRELGLRYMKPDVPDQDFWPAEGTPQWSQAERWQDIYALTKMRRYMDDVAWVDFKLGVRNGLRSASFEERTVAVRKLWDEHKALAHTEEESVIRRSPAMRQYPKNVTVRAENNRYEEQLRIVYEIRGLGGALDAAGKVNLAEALGKSSFLAQEAYHTSGAVRDIVCNLQMGQGLTLSAYEHLHSFNEQAGDIFKDLGRFPAPPEGGMTLEFAVDASKYMVRMASAGLSANYNLVTKILEVQFARLAAGAPEDAARANRAHAAQENYATGLDERLNRLLDFQELFEAWRSRALKLMKIKDNPGAYKTAGNWNADATSLLAEAPWAKERTDFFHALLSLAITMNVETRTNPAVTVRDGLAGGGVRFRVGQARIAWAEK